MGEQNKLAVASWDPACSAEVCYSMYSVYDEPEGRADSMMAWGACHLCHNGNKKAGLLFHYMLNCYSFAKWKDFFPLTQGSARDRPAVVSVSGA